jgi:hypothetical protein
MISLSRNFFLGLHLLCFKEGALGSEMPTQTAVMAYRRSSDGMRLLSAWNIIIVSILASFCVLDKITCMCKDAVNRDFLFRALSEDFALRRFRFPVSRPDNRAIPSGRPSDHCSIRPDNVPYRPNASQTKHHSSGRRTLLSGPSTVSRRFYPACIRPDVSATRPDASWN